MLFIGYLFDRLANENIKAYLVGGEAIAIYTAAQFTTENIDITTTNRENTIKILNELNFVSVGRIWYNEDLGLTVDVVDSFPSDTSKTRIMEIENYKINIVGIEDLVINRLVSAKYWKSNTKLDIEQVTVLLLSHKNSVDWNYMKKSAIKQNVTDFLDEVTVWINKN